jgi:uncharacterized protein DUF6518
MASMSHDGRMSPRVRVALVLVGAFVFGWLAAWAKGQDTDGLSTISQVRGAFGNLSAPWLLVGFVAGTQTSRLRNGALLGLAATLAGLAGFYLMTSLVVDLGGRNYLDNLAQELAANRAYFEGAVIAGPLFGLLGAWWRQNRTVRASVLAGALLMAEPLVLILIGLLFPNGMSSSGGGLPLVVRIVPGWGLTASRTSGVWMAVYAVEFLAGLSLLLYAVIRVRALRQAQQTAAEPRSGVA